MLENLVPMLLGNIRTVSVFALIEEQWVSLEDNPVNKLCIIRMSAALRLKTRKPKLLEERTSRKKD